MQRLFPQLSITRVDHRLALLVSVGFLLCSAIACDRDDPAQGSASPGAEKTETEGEVRATPVVVATVRFEEFVDRIEALGTARANESVIITAQVTEMVTDVGFEDGQVVEAGHVLVELTSQEESAQLAAARANYDEALRQYRRVSDLVKQGSDSRSNLDQRVAARDSAAALLAELQAKLADRMIVAPFAGVLGLRSVSPGTVVKPGDEITTLDDIDLIKLDFSVPESYLASLQPGLEIRASSVAYAGKQFTGRVSAVDTRVDPRTRAVRVRAVIANPEHLLYPGMLLTVDLRSNPRRSISLPEQAIVPEGDRHYVFIADADDIAQRLEVRIGARSPGAVEILEGLSGEERVVVDGVDLRAGNPLRVVSARSAPES